MVSVNLSFKAFDIHELLCHFVALEAGLYREQDIDVKLIDSTFVPDDQLPGPIFHAACGGALMGWLKGAPLKVVFTATDRPMFWLYSQPDIKDLEALKGARIAGFPGIAPPAYFLSAVLKQQLIDCDEVMIEPVRDDTARLGLLTTGDAMAAVISSAIPPAMMEQLGYRPLLFFGNCIRVPTTGLAVSSSLTETQPDLVRAMVDIHRQSLNLIQKDNALMGSVLGDYLRIPEDLRAATIERLRHCFSREGFSSEAVTQAAVQLMSRELGLTADQLPEETLYDYYWLGENS